MANKITKMEVIEKMLSEEFIQSNEMYRTFLEHEKELLAKRAGAKKPTKVQTENETLKAHIVEIITTSEKPMTVTEIITTGALGITNQKATAMVTALVNEGKLVRGTGEKRKTVFSLAQYPVKPRGGVKTAPTKNKRQQKWILKKDARIVHV